MQIYAFDHNFQLVHIHQARRGVAYTCPECQHKVRLRGGKVRQPHFYHLETTPCRLAGKSLTHLSIQLALQGMLSADAVSIEHSFPEISRIADVAWPAQKVVFEIQVSPISPTEVRARNRDYHRAGYQVVWILHDRRYNRSRLTGAEAALRFSPHYFTNMNAFGKGFFYDQYSWVQARRRTTRSPRFPMRFNRVIPVNPKQLPRHFPLERRGWPFSFEGDLFHLPLSWHPPYRPPFSWTRPFVRFYRLLHDLLLEKTTY